MGKTVTFQHPDGTSVSGLCTVGQDGDGGQ